MFHSEKKKPLQFDGRTVELWVDLSGKKVVQLSLWFNFRLMWLQQQLPCPSLVLFQTSCSIESKMSSNQRSLRHTLISTFIFPELYILQQVIFQRGQRQVEASADFVLPMDIQAISFRIYLIFVVLVIIFNNIDQPQALWEVFLLVSSLIFHPSCIFSVM